MKKIIGIFSILLIAGIMLLNVNLSFNSKADVDVYLAGLIATNVANAETQATGCIYSGDWNDSCKHNGVTVKRCYSNATGECWY
ncbi:MAG: hypothetical protein PHG29_06860 [Prolixibacteraceae bacterium]|nr:hypothetical protein [Prolixibacteraceae bacterium]